MANNNFPITLNHNYTGIAKNIHDLVKQTKQSLEDATDEIPQKIGKDTFVNNQKVDGKNYIRSSSKKSFNANKSKTQIDLNKISGNSNNIKTFKGDDFIFTNGDKNKIEAGEGNDTLIISGNNQTKLDPNKGDDTVFLDGNDNTLGHNRIGSYNEGDDTYSIKGNSNTIYSGDGEDTLLLAGDENTVDTGNDNDKIAISGSNNKIETYKGDDYVDLYGQNNSINTDRGDDIVSVKGDSNVVRTSTGNDIIDLHGNDNKIFSGDGDDVINIESYSEVVDGENITYTPSSGLIETGDGTDQVNINVISGDFKIVGGSGSNKLKLANIDLAAYSGNYQNGNLELFRADGTGSKLNIQLTNFESVEFANNNVYSLEQLTGIKGKEIELNTTQSLSNISNEDGQSNLLKLDFSFSKLIGVEQVDDTSYKLSYYDSNQVQKDITLNGIYHLETTDAKEIDLTQIPDFKTINSDISNFSSASVRQFNNSYQVKIFDDALSEEYDLTLDSSKSNILALDPNDNSKITSYNADQYIHETFGNLTTVSALVANNDTISNTDQKTNVADFQNFDTEQILQVERARGKTYQNTQILARNPSSDMSEINITFDGTSTLDTIINAYNIANPNNQVEHKGTGTDILATGSLKIKNTDTLGNQYRVIIDNGSRKSFTLDRVNAIKTKEGSTISLEQMFDTLDNSLNYELSKIDTASVNYDQTAHNGLKETMFRRGAYNVLNARNDNGKYDVISSLAGATYQLLPATGNSIAPVPSIQSVSSTLSASNANLIDGQTETYFSSAKKSVSATESFTLDLGSSLQFSKITIDPRADFDGLFPDNFTIYAGDDVNNLTAIQSASADQLKSGLSITPTTARYVKAEFNNKQLAASSDYYAEIGNVIISNPTNSSEQIFAASVSDFSSQTGINLASNLVDDNNSTLWESVHSNGQTTESILLDLTTSKDVSKLRIRPASGATNFFPNDLDIFVGDDPFNLSLVSSVTGYNSIDPLFNDFDFTETSGQYVKINMKSRLDASPDPDEYYLKLAEIDVIGNNASSGIIATTIDSVSSSEATDFSSDATHLVDNNSSTFFTSNVAASATADSFVLDLGSSQTLSGIDFVARLGKEGLFPSIDNILIDNNPNPITSVSNIASNGTNFSFDSITGQYIKVNFTSKQDGITGNFYSQIAEASPVTTATVKNKSEVQTLANSLLNGINFQSSDGNHTIDDATKGLYSLRLASALRNRSDLVQQIIDSNLTIEFNPNPTITSGSDSFNGLATLSSNGNATYKVQLTTDSFYFGAFDNEDGDAVDYHEISHILDYLSGAPNGSPVLMNNTERLAFGNARGNLFAPLDYPATPPLGEGLLYPSAGTDPLRIASAENSSYKNTKEFLAYATEVFFERGDELQNLSADGDVVYQKLRNYFGLVTDVADPDNNIFVNQTPVL